MTKSAPKADPKAVAAYIDAAPEPARSRLRALADAVRAEAPEAVERIAYGLATWHQGENLIHLGAFQHHVGIYPGAAAIVAFADELEASRTSKGAIQVPHDAPLPTSLVRRITRWRLEQARTKATPKASRSRARGAHAVTGPAEIAAYNPRNADRISPAISECQPSTPRSCFDFGSMQKSPFQPRCLCAQVAWGLSPGRWNGDRG